MPTGIYKNKQNRNGTPEERFWRCVKKEKNACWEWIGVKYEKGYGQIEINGKNKRAHRFSYELHKGKIPKGLCVCHSCDNPQCTNPKHLWLGTNKDNTRDMIKKGRGAKGEGHGRAKLTQKQVDEIRKDYIPLKNSMNKLAKKYGVSDKAIFNIINNKTWKQ